MNNLWVMAGELRGYTQSYFRQCCYLIPVIGIICILAFGYPLMLWNQKSFLSDMKYDSIEIKENRSLQGEENGVSLDCLEGESLVLREEEAYILYQQEYPCEVFLTAEPSAVNWEDTYFTLTNTRGFSPAQLQYNEIILSENAANHLKVKAGDEIALLSESMEDFCRVTVRCIMKTKYPYQRIGEAGTILACLPREEMEDLSADLTTYVFRESDQGNLSLEEERKECSFWNQAIHSLQLQHIFFPVLGILLFLLLFHREIRRSIRLQKYDFYILQCLGASGNLSTVYHFFVETTILSGSTFLALLLYKAIYVRIWMGEYAGFLFCFRIMGLFYLLGSLLVAAELLSS